MVIYLRHSEHGEKVASAEQEAALDERNGWKRYEPSTEFAPIPASDEKIREEWEAKFGKKPHHKKSINALAKELE